MPATKAQQRAVNKYMAANYDRINLTVPKGQKETIQAHATARSESVNGFIGRAIAEAMERDDGGTPSKIAQQAEGTAQRDGAVSLPSGTLEAAQRAADAAGEDLPRFVARAVAAQAERDAQRAEDED